MDPSSIAETSNPFLYSEFTHPVQPEYETCQSHIGDLPAELMIKILNYINEPSLARALQPSLGVCRNWNVLASHTITSHILNELKEHFTDDPKHAERLNRFLKKLHVDPIKLLELLKTIFLVGDKNISNKDPIQHVRAREDVQLTAREEKWLTLINHILEMERKDLHRTHWFEPHNHHNGELWLMEVTSETALNARVYERYVLGTNRFVTPAQLGCEKIVATNNETIGIYPRDLDLLLIQGEMSILRRLRDQTIEHSMHHPDPQKREVAKSRLLHWTAICGTPDELAALLATNVAVDRLSLFARTPLHYAAIRGDLLILEMLLTAGANPNICVFNDMDQQTVTPLRLAIANEHLECVRALTANVANLFDINNFARSSNFYEWGNGGTATPEIFDFAFTKNLEIFKHLITISEEALNPARKIFLLSKAFRYTPELCDPRCLEFLFSKFTDLTREDLYALFNTGLINNLSMENFEYLLQRITSVAPVIMFECLSTALSQGRIDLAEWLFSHGLTVHREVLLLQLQVALFRSSGPKVVPYLMEKFSDITQDEIYHLLKVCVRENSSQGVDLILPYLQNVNHLVPANHDGEPNHVNYRVYKLGYQLAVAPLECETISDQSTTQPINERLREAGVVPGVSVTAFLIMGIAIGIFTNISTIMIESMLYDDTTSRYVRYPVGFTVLSIIFLGMFQAVGRVLRSSETTRRTVGRFSEPVARLTQRL